MGTRMVLGALLLLAGCGGEDHTLYPLKEGQTWEYQVSTGSMLGSAGGQRATLVNLPQRDLKGRRVTPQKIEIGQQSHFFFIAADDSGIYEYAKQGPGAVEPEIPSTPSYYLRNPLKAGAAWDGKTETNLLMNKLTISVKTTIEALDETVTVPAGTFQKCVKTMTVGQTAHNLGPTKGMAEVNVEEHSWFCTGVGMVKVVRKEVSNNPAMGSGQVSMELASFKK